MKQEMAKPLAEKGNLDSTNLLKTSTTNFYDNLKGRWFINADGLFKLWWDLANVSLIVSFEYI